MSIFALDQLESRPVGINRQFSVCLSSNQRNLRNQRLIISFSSLIPARRGCIIVLQPPAFLHLSPSTHYFLVASAQLALPDTPGSVPE